MEKETNNEEKHGYVLDRETKLMLLRWLRDGIIDRNELASLSDAATSSMTKEELDDEINRYVLGFNDDICEIIMSGGLCKYCYANRKPREKPLPLPCRASRE